MMTNARKLELEQWLEEHQGETVDGEVREKWEEWREIVRKEDVAAL